MVAAWKRAEASWCKWGGAGAVGRVIAWLEVRRSRSRSVRRDSMHESFAAKLATSWLLEVSGNGPTVRSVAPWFKLLVMPLACDEP